MHFLIVIFKRLVKQIAAAKNIVSSEKKGCVLCKSVFQSQKYGQIWSIKNVSSFHKNSIPHVVH